MKKTKRSFTNCPRCGAKLEPCPSFAGANSEYFLECSQCNTYVNTYIPQTHQASVHSDTHRIIGNFGGYGTGKTTTSRQEIHKHYLITPNANILIGANITPQYEQTIKREFEMDLPAAFVKEYSSQKSYVDLINGARIMYRPLDDEGKLRSLNLTMYVIVEASEVKSEAFHQLKTRHRNTAAAKQLYKDGVPQFRFTRSGQPVPILEHDWRKAIIESNPDAGWIRTDVLLASDSIAQHGGAVNEYEVSEEEKDKNISSHIASTDVNEFLPPGFIEELTKNKPEWWINRYIYSSFLYAEGLVYPATMKSIIPHFEPDRAWKRLVAFDYGLSDDAAYVFAAVDEEHGEVHIYKDVATNDQNIETYANLFFENTKDILAGAWYTQPIIDPKSGAKRDYEKKTLISHFQDYGIYFKPGQISVDARVLRVNTYLESGKLKIHDNCTYLINQLKDYKYPERQLGVPTGKIKPMDKNNHAINPLEWICMELPADPSKLTWGVYNRFGEDISNPRKMLSPFPDDESYDEYDESGFGANY